MSTKNSKKVRLKKCTEKNVFSAHLGAEYFIEKTSKNHQKTLTQACQILQKWPFLKKSHMLESGFFDDFLTFFNEIFCP